MKLRCNRVVDNVQVLLSIAVLAVQMQWNLNIAVCVMDQGSSWLGGDQGRHIVASLFDGIVLQLGKTNFATMVSLLSSC